VAAFENGAWHPLGNDGVGPTTALSAPTEARLIAGDIARAHHLIALLLSRE
jgi:hypothetical protein